MGGTGPLARQPRKFFYFSAWALESIFKRIFKDNISCWAITLILSYLVGDSRHTHSTQFPLEK